MDKDTQIYMRFELENELYNAIFKAAKMTGAEGLHFILETAPVVIDEIVNKYRDATRNPRNYECIISLTSSKV